MNKQRIRYSYIKTAVLSIAIIFLILIINKIANRGLPESLLVLFNYQQPSLAGIITEEKKKNILENIAGFWVYNSIDSNKQEPFILSDRLEIKDNGIFWQVKELVINLPVNTTEKCIYVATGYIEPFKQTNDSTEVVCNIYNRYQTLITRTDTCYISSAVVQKLESGKTTTAFKDVLLWNIVPMPKSLKIDRNTYFAYDTSEGRLYKFFPEGLIDIVDDINIDKCIDESKFVGFARRTLQQGLAAMTVKSRDSAETRKFISLYYEPLIIEELVNRYNIYLLKPVKGYIVVKLAIKWDGTIEKCEFKKNTISNKYFLDQFKDEITTWRFPQLADSSESYSLTYTFNFAGISRF